MVTAVGSYNALAYLNQVKGIAPVTPPPSVPTSDNTDTTGSTAPTGNNSSLSSSPSLNNLLGLSSDVLSLLQGTGTGSDNGNIISSLFGSSAITSNSDPLAGVYSTLLYNASSVAPIAQAVQATQQQQAQDNANQGSNVASLLTANNSVLNAYNKTLQQTAQSVAAANNYQADGKTKLVA